MSEHRVELEWKRSTPDFGLKNYNRGHTATFKNEQPLAMSAAVAFLGDADRVDPEEAFVASMASCHMLTFLAIASRRGLVIDSYSDQAIGHLERNESGKLAITRLDLRPRIRFAGAAPDDATLHDMHEQAHADCFIANSVLTRVNIEPIVE